MKSMLNYKSFLNEQLDPKPSTKDILDAYTNDAQARSNINGAIQSNASYNSVLTAIKNYWTNQSTQLKAKAPDQLTDTDTNNLDTINDKLKNGDPREIENYAMGKVLGGHAKELTYNKDTKTLTIQGYTENEYDKSIKTKI